MSINNIRPSFHIQCHGGANVMALHFTATVTQTINSKIITHVVCVLGLSPRLTAKLSCLLTVIQLINVT